MEERPTEFVILGFILMEQGWELQATRLTVQATRLLIICPNQTYFERLGQAHL